MARWIAIGILWAEGIAKCIGSVVVLVASVCLGVLCLPVLGMAWLANRSGPVRAPEQPSAPQPVDTPEMRATKVNALELAMKNNPNADPQWMMDRALELN